MSEIYSWQTKTNPNFIPNPNRFPWHHNLYAFWKKNLERLDYARQFLRMLNMATLEITLFVAIYIYG